MKLLVDTHALLWWWTDDPRLSRTARTLIQNDANTVLVSAASAWEIATKWRLGKLPLGKDVVARFHELMELDAFQPLPMNAAHALLAGVFSQSHRDPFDRMLAAQSHLESVPLVTCDSAFDAFPVKVIW